MVREVRTEITINTAKERLWQELTAFSEYSSWNPFMKFIHGEAKLGSNIVVNIEFSNGDKMNFKPKITVVEENKRLTWIGKLLMKGIFDGKHVFEIEEVSDSECRLIHKETFSGFLVPLMWKKVKANTSESFVRMNEALKIRCETRL